MIRGPDVQRRVIVQSNGSCSSIGIGVNCWRQRWSLNLWLVEIHRTGTVTQIIVLETYHNYQSTFDWSVRDWYAVIKIPISKNTYVDSFSLFVVEMKIYFSPLFFLGLITTIVRVFGSQQNSSNCRTDTQAVMWPESVVDPPCFHLFSSSLHRVLYATLWGPYRECVIADWKLHPNPTHGSDILEHG